MSERAVPSRARGRQANARVRRPPAREPVLECLEIDAVRRWSETPSPVLDGRHPRPAA